jgi:hypothetical protein
MDKFKDDGNNGDKTLSLNFDDIIKESIIDRGYIVEEPRNTFHVWTINVRFFIISYIFNK